jgi:peroxiredoxin
MNFHLNGMYFSGMKISKSIYIFIVSCLFSLTLVSQTPDSTGYLVKVGDIAPGFEFEYTDGTHAKLSDFQGKVVMLQFTASWCKVCREEMPLIQEKIWQVYKDQGLVLIGVDRDEPREDALAFAKKMKITYPLALDPGADIFGLYAVKQSGVTRNVIIDRDGRIMMLTRLFKEDEFNRMVQVIDGLIKNP